MDIIQDPFGLVQGKVGMAGDFQFRGGAAMNAPQVAAPGDLPGYPLRFKFHGNFQKKS